MKVLDKKGFKLPYVDGQTYRELMRLGLHYDKQARSYSAEDLDDARINDVLALVSKILHEQVCFEQSKEGVQKGIGRGIVEQVCLICGKRFQCDGCRYFELCETKNKASSCICGTCLEEGRHLKE